MGYIQKRDGRFRARYRDPLGRMTSITFERKTDAQRFLAEMETDKVRERGSIPATPTCPWRASGVSCDRNQWARRKTAGR